MQHFRFWRTTSCSTTTAHNEVLYILPQKPNNYFKIKNDTHVQNQRLSHQKNTVTVTVKQLCPSQHLNLLFVCFVFLVVFFFVCVSSLSPIIPYLSMFLIWLCNAKKDTGESIASRLLAHRRTTFSPVWWIFSVNWSTAILLGAQTNTGLEKIRKKKKFVSYKLLPGRLATQIRTVTIHVP